MVALKSFEQFVEEMDAMSSGTFVGMKATPKTARDLFNFSEKHAIPNSLPMGDFHVTVVYSREQVLPDKVARGYLKKALKAKAYKLEVFPTEDYDEDGFQMHALVLKLKSPQLERRHQLLKSKHNASHTFDEYIPHVTLSYNYSPLLAVPPMPDFPIEFDFEYTKPIEYDWNKSL